MELPVIAFIQERLAEADVSLETREGSAHYDLFVQPQQLMLQPLIDAMDTLQTAQSIARILALTDPDAFDEQKVDDLVANLYVYRDVGALAKTTVRVFYDEPKDKEFPALTAEFTSTAGSFFNTNDVKITASEMALNTDGSVFYMDIAVQAGAEGDSYNTPAGGITGFVNDSEAISVTNLTDAVGGLPRETNTELLTRAQNSIGVRDLETNKGINAILREKFPFLREIVPVGMGDPEMMRDILFNAHVGGKTDVYLKTPTLTNKSTNIIGLDYDLTREISRNVHLEMARSLNDIDYSSDLETPNIVVGSVTVKEDVVETAASILSAVIPPGVGIDLSAGEWIKIQIDNLPLVNIKVSGATPSATQRFEIINAINATVGYTVVVPAPNNKILLSSLVIGSGSQIIFHQPQFPRTDATPALFGISLSYPATQTLTGIVAEQYVETVDYVVDYIDGRIYQTSYPGSRPLSGYTILSGQEMISSDVDGQITSSLGQYYFESSFSSKFLNQPFVKVRVGDEVTIELINGLSVGTVLGTLPKTFIVSEVVANNKLRLAQFAPTGTTGVNSIQYSVKSNQVVIVDYKFNPISIDVGPQVLLADGNNRGVRPGRGSYTINDVPFINITEIIEIDPDTLETIGSPLTPPQGYGFGGFGEGGYGVGLGGDYEFIVNSPTERFSVYEDSVIVLGPLSLSKSYKVSYNCVPEILAIHQLSRNDLERVTGADVLPKNFVPAMVDIEIGIRRDPTSVETPDNATLASMVDDIIHSVKAAAGLQASDIIKMLEEQAVASVKTPFNMTATVYNTDGSISVVESEDVLTIPSVTLAKDTPNFVTPKIVHFYPNNVSVVEVP